jgi:hypothetical protein
MTTITASPKDIHAHIANLSNASFLDLAHHVARDPSESNRAIVRLVADLRVAEANADLAAETRKLREVTGNLFVVAIIAALISTVVSVVALVR